MLRAWQIRHVWWSRLGRSTRSRRRWLAVVLVVVVVVILLGGARRGSERGGKPRWRRLGRNATSSASDISTPHHDASVTETRRLDRPISITLAMAAPQTVRRWILTGSVTAITITGALYGAGLKSSQEKAQVRPSLSTPPPRRAVPFGAPHRASDTRF
jgi:cell division protein FtsW (lipid II flippase)